MTTIRATLSAATKQTIALLLLTAVCTGCFPRNQPLRPRMQYVAKKSDLRPLQSPFPALEPHERKTDWGIEYQVGLGFARELDLYRAVTSFKRALILIPKSKKERRLELNYHIAHAYFLGDRYEDLLVTVEESDLLQVTPDFPAYQDLLVMLHTAYVATGECEKAAFMAAHLNAQDAELAEEIETGTALSQACLPALTQNPETSDFMATYCRCRKSVGKAQFLSAALPGAGFWYVGQKQSAITAFLLNGLFIAAAVQLFCRGHWALGSFVTSLEMGWYFGGIYGAAEAAHLYNERLYERLADPTLRQKRLYPTLRLQWGF